MFDWPTCSNVVSRSSMESKSGWIYRYSQSWKKKHERNTPVIKEKFSLAFLRIFFPRKIFLFGAPVCYRPVDNNPAGSEWCRSCRGWRGAHNCADCSRTWTCPGINTNNPQKFTRIQEKSRKVQKNFQKKCTIICYCGGTITISHLISQMFCPRYVNVREALLHKRWNAAVFQHISTDEIHGGDERHIPDSTAGEVQIKHFTLLIKSLFSILHATFFIFFIIIFISIFFIIIFISKFFFKIFIYEVFNFLIFISIFVFEFLFYIFLYFFFAYFIL